MNTTHPDDLNGGREALEPLPDTALLPQTMPAAVALGMASFLTLATLIAALVIVLVPFPESVTSPFVLKPTAGMEPMQAPRDSIIEEVLVTDGSSVEAGTVLFVLRSDELRKLATERTDLRREIAGNQAKLARLQAEAVAHRLVDPAALAELERLRVYTATALTTDPGTALTDFTSVNALQDEEFRLKLANAEQRVARLRALLPLARQQLATARELLDKLERAYNNKRSATELEVIRQRYEYQQAQLELQRVPFELKEAEAELAALKTSQQLAVNAAVLATVNRAAEIRQLELAIAAGEERLAALEQELVHADGDRLTVVAPRAGVVFDLAVRQPGAVVERGNTLCQLAQPGADIQAELHLPEKAVGLLHPEQNVRLLFDAFPYTRYGVQNAILTWISPVGADGTFRGLAKLESSTIVVEGQQRLVKAGMKGEARIAIGRRTLLQYILEPLRQLRENTGIASTAG